ncbi:2OG-Fe(II) oxygenase [Paenibacillus doosanensis]|uniref:2OG-Fe(II) oxygenase n=1 Tax=Paenibacillus doosanensis TaxID=1229154 RepID=UPI0021803229|nr:2OG-Fe(II) oxygenase [Paenibacillus doosanensis]MCS7463801.1 2OG-Fe(II) oxygenase [Paenibacillus doosanensis]
MHPPLPERIAGLNWGVLQHSLNEDGYAKLPALLHEDECREIIGTYDDDSYFRGTVSMARYRFGIGEYRYFAAPLPVMLQQLREGLYPALAGAANQWQERLGQPPVYPSALADFSDHCRAHGQTRATPLILKYETGGHNCLHQDLYGKVHFPFQVVFALNRQGADYTGGQFLLVEQRPRAQSRGHVITLEQGEGLIFPTRHRPVPGARGYYRTMLRHGVATVTSGLRYSLGILFHDAE